MTDLLGFFLGQVESEILLLNIRCVVEALKKNCPLNHFVDTDYIFISNYSGQKIYN